MLPSFLITFREVIEASLIVATILGILVKLGQKKEIKTVLLATITAVVSSVFLLGLGSVVGLKTQELYSSKIEKFTEGFLMILSAIFITWAVFFLHNYFGKYKTKLLAKIKNTVGKEKQKGLFVLVFTAVFREGFEIVLFLSTIFFSSDPQSIFVGFITGAASALLVCFGLFTATLRLPVYLTFKTTSILLILFAAGLLARGVHEFSEIGILPETAKMTLFFLPTASFVSDIVKSIFGLSHKMTYLEIIFWATYVSFMSWWVFGRKKVSSASSFDL